MGEDDLTALADRLRKEVARPEEQWVTIGDMLAAADVLDRVAALAPRIREALEGTPETARSRDLRSVSRDVLAVIEGEATDGE